VVYSEETQPFDIEVGPLQAVVAALFSQVIINGISPTVDA